MKSIDTQAYLGQLTVLLEAGKTVNLVVSGSSMEPFLIHQRDAVLLEKPDRPYRKGDIVLFRRCGGKYVLHRICKLTAQGAYLIGDGQTAVEGPVAISQMIAIVTQVRRKEHIIGPGDFRWKFFARLWIRMIPLRPLFLRIYSAAAKLLRRG